MNTEELIEKYKNQIRQIDNNIAIAEKNKNYRWLDSVRIPYAIKTELIKKFITDLEKLSK